MKLLRILAWIAFPYITIFFRFKSLTSVKRIFAVVWTVFAVIMMINVATTSPQNEAPSVTDVPAVSSEATTKAPEKTEQSTEPETQTNDPDMTLEEFNAIQTGMSYDEVTSIVGSSGTLMSESSIGEGTDFYVKTQMFDYEGNAMFSSANVTFQNGEVVMKSQFGLE